MEFRRENFRGLLACTAYCRPSLQTIVEKSFTDWHKTAKFAKVFSLESFPLYVIHLHVLKGNTLLFNFSGTYLKDREYYPFNICRFN